MLFSSLTVAFDFNLLWTSSFSLKVWQVDFCFGVGLRTPTVLNPLFRCFSEMPLILMARFASFTCQLWFKDILVSRMIWLLIKWLTSLVCNFWTSYPRWRNIEKVWAAPYSSWGYFCNGNIQLITLNRTIWNLELVQFSLAFWLKIYFNDEQLWEVFFEFGCVSCSISHVIC